MQMENEVLKYTQWRIQEFLKGVQDPQKAGP